MKKNIGNKFAFYPTPVIVVGAFVDGKPDFTLVAHIGIVTHDTALISLNQSHYINGGIKASNTLSVNVVDESWLEKAVLSGSVSGRNTDLSSNIPSAMRASPSSKRQSSPWNVSSQTSIRSAHLKILLSGS